MLIILFCFARESKMPLITMSDYNNEIKSIYMHNTSFFVAVVER